MSADVMPVNAWLAQLARDAETLKTSVRAARVNHCLSDRHYNKVQTSVANIMSAVAEALGPYVHLPKPPTHEATLGEFIPFPSEKSKCPKCRRNKPRFRYWRPGTDDIPEHVEHKCECGYFIITKPADRSEDLSEDGLFDWEDSPYDDGGPSIRTAAADKPIDRWPL